MIFVVFYRAFVNKYLASFHLGFRIWHIKRYIFETAKATFNKCTLRYFYTFTEFFLLLIFYPVYILRLFHLLFLHCFPFLRLPSISTNLEILGSICFCWLMLFGRVFGRPPKPKILKFLAVYLIGPAEI